MPDMDKLDPKAVFGAGKESEEEDESGGEFESAIVDAFPELEGKPERIASLKQAIEACQSAASAGEYE
jgi:hypothetical protein